ncbi:hypothetical protein [Peribacillus butanolivorans]
MEILTTGTFVTFGQYLETIVSAISIVVNLIGFISTYSSYKTSS